MSDPARLSPDFGCPASVPIRYVPHERSECGAGGLRDERISEAHLRLAAKAGSLIRRVVVVESDVGSGRELLAYVLLGQRTKFLQIATRRYEGAKVFNDFRRLRRTLVEDAGYVGPVYFYPAGHPFLLHLGLPHYP